MDRFNEALERVMFVLAGIGLVCLLDGVGLGVYSPGSEVVCI